MRIIELDSTGSTNAEARHFAQTADFGPLWIRADQQTSGRGRNGREWVSPKGNLYASHLFATEEPLHRLGLFSFVSALAVYDTLAALHPGGKWGLKWPNDLLLGKAKICGMLLETGKTHHQSWVIMGIGINLASHPSDTPYPATSLAAHLPETPSAQYVVTELSVNFENWKTDFETKGFAPIRSAWLDRATNLPGKVTVRLAQETFEGEAINLRENGALQVRLSNGTMRDVHAGDVYLG